jgi:4,5-DOPA dioxygenase extradiol
MYPVLFIGHGSPMNAIEDNIFTKEWKNIASSIGKPKIILSISAHWVTKGTKIHSAASPRTIYDFYYFPKELYEITYSASGSEEYAKKTLELIPGAKLDQSWGLDHGTWSVLQVMYPDADLKVFQLSIDRSLSPSEYYDLGVKLKTLRKHVLIMGTGNVVHNLRKADFAVEGCYNWAEKYDSFVHENVLARNHEAIINYDKIPESQLAFPTTEHFNPLLYVLGATEETDTIEVYNKQCVFGSVSMTSYLFKPN